MQPVTMYYKPTCPYCQRAHSLLTAKGVMYEGIDISKYTDRRAEMIERAHGRTTVPQIFIGETHVGGCDDLYALDDAGKLEALLNG
ncbi:MAG: glutaredoxin 3 [Cardiobacteriaceae bacterium]|nr:glutaredoxin 3 [Cardiobacteriaceae bacterium]